MNDHFDGVHSTDQMRNLTQTLIETMITILYDPSGSKPLYYFIKIALAAMGSTHYLNPCIRTFALYLKVPFGFLPIQLLGSYRHAVFSDPSV